MHKSNLKKQYLLFCILLLLPVVTTTARENAGDVFLVPSMDILTVNTSFHTELRVNTGSSDRVGAYGVEIFYNPAVVMYNMQSVEGGIDVNMSDFVTVINADKPGIISMAGFRTDGLGPGEGVHLADIYWLALDSGITSFDLNVRSLTDTSVQNGRSTVLRVG